MTDLVLSSRVVAGVLRSIKLKAWETYPGGGYRCRQQNLWKKGRDTRRAESVTVSFDRGLWMSDPQKAREDARVALVARGFMVEDRLGALVVTLPE